MAEMSAFKKYIPLFAKCQTLSPFHRYHKTGWKRNIFAMVTNNVCVNMLKVI